MSTTPRIEYRIFKSECRAGKGDKPSIDGYAAVFNTTTDIGWYREQIAPGAFKDAIDQKQDVRCLFNHDPNKVLGRTKNGTLTLKEDNTGLHYTNDMDMTTSVGKDVYAHIKRGDIDQCSFGFVVRDEEVSYDKDNVATRTIKQADLFDVSPVTYPAYPTTSVEARSNAEALKKYRKVDPDDVDPDDDNDPDDVDPDAPDADCACRCRACFDADCRECDMHINDCQADACDHEDGADDLDDSSDNNSDSNDDGDDDERSVRISGVTGDNILCWSTSISAAEERAVIASIAAKLGKNDEEVESHWRALVNQRAAAKTLKVDGEELTAGAFLYVGDPDTTSTWALPWKFSSAAKTKSHLRNALARFNQTKTIPASEKASVYKKLVAKCKTYGIDVDEKKSSGLDVENAKRRTYLASLTVK